MQRAATTTGTALWFGSTTNSAVLLIRVLVTEQGLQPLRRVAAGRECAGLAAALESLELLGEVPLEPAAVLALEGTQGLDLGVEPGLLLLQLTELLLTALRGLRVEHLRTRAGIGIETIGFGLALGLEALGLRARLAEDLVGLVLGVRHELIGVAGRDLQQTCRRAGRFADGGHLDGLLRSSDRCSHRRLLGLGCLRRDRSGRCRSRPTLLCR